MFENDDSIVTDESAQHDAEAGNNDNQAQAQETVDEQNKDEPAEETPVDPRAARLAEIAENRRKEREEEQGQDDEPEAQGGVEGEDDVPEELDEELPEAAEVDSPIITRDGQQFIKAKVNGVEQEIPMDKALRTLQINESADQRLNQVSMREKQLTERELQLNQFAQQIQQSSQQSDQPSNKDVDVETKQKELARDYREAIMSGEDEKADEILVEMNNLGRSPATPVMDADNLVQTAVTQIREQDEVERRKADSIKANKDFKKDFPEIVSDPQLMTLARGHAKELMSANPNRTPSDVMQEVGKNVREWVGKMKGPSHQQARQDRKRQAAAKTASGNNAAAQMQGKDPEPPKTRSQVIGDMKRQRPGAS